MNMRLMSTGTMKGDSVKNREGKDIGSVEEFMMNPETGQVEYAVLSFGGFMGLGDKYFAVPWNAFSLDKDQKVLKLDVSKEKLKEAPGFDKDDWPDFGDTDFINTVNQTYHGVGGYTYAAS